MSGEKSSLHPFLMEPMAELESGVDFLDTVNIEDERNIELKERKGDSAKDRKDVEAGSNSGLIKKTRTKISLYQKLELECAFLQTPYPSRAVRAHLAHRLGLKHQTLLNWFKKRRYRWRRQSLNPGVPVLCSSILPEGPLNMPGEARPQDSCQLSGCFQAPYSCHYQDNQQPPFF
ncbi:homeobox protein unc-4-like [Pocillopora damicornis]|uniref:homeobox protein unc-4-like n=1 Tax=Pocillopora damicornis TaxID=46731 RepID=UPI000F550A09|nr:homeobox protein unc-4-like [Pocillopora damicornis]